MNVTSAVHLPNSTVLKGNGDKSCNIKCELTNQTEQSEGSAKQADESTDFTSLSSVLLAFVTYIYRNHIEEQMLMRKSLPAHTTGVQLS
jgi:hypothetical protein